MSPADTLPPLDLGLLDLGALTDFALPDLTLSLPISPDSPEDHGAFSLDTPPTENPPAIMSTQSLSATPVLGRERSSSLPGYASPATVTFAFPPTPAHIASTLPSPGHSQSTFEFPATPPNMKCESPLPVPLHPFANSSALFRSISPISFGLSVNGNELSPVPQPVIQLSAEKELPPIPLPLDVSDELDELTSTIGSDSYGSAESDALEVVLDIDCDRLLPTVRMSTSAPRDRRKHRPMITTKQPMVHIQEPTPSDESPSAEENAAKRGFRGTLPAALAAPPSSPTTPASPGASKSLRRMSKRQSYISAAPQSPEELLSQAQIRVLERTAESLNPPPPVEMTSGPALAGVFSPPPHMSSSTTESFGDSLILAVPGTPPSLPLSAILPSFPKTPTTPNSLPPSAGLWYRTNSSAAPSPGSGKSIFGPPAVWTPPKPHSKTLPSHPPPNVALPPTPPSAIAALPNLWPPMSASFPQSPAQRAHGTTPSPSRAPSPFQRAPSPLQCAPSPLQRARSPLSQIASPAQRPSSLSPMPSCYSSPLLPPSPLLTNTLPPASVVAVDFFRLLAQEKEQLLDERQKLKRATLETERAREVPDSLKAELQKMRIELERVRKEAGTLRAGRQLAEGEVQHLRAEVQAMRGEVEKAKLEAGRVRFEGSGLAAANARAMEENARVLARVGAERDAAVRDAERAWRDKELLARECERLRVERRKLLDEGRDAKRGLELADEKVRWLMKSGETLRVEMDMLGRENALLQRELGARAREREQEQKWMASAAGVPMNA